MSSLLGEAIVDAKALRESALKNAESTIIEKYSDEVKKTLEALLEQEEDLAAGLDAAPTETPDLGLGEEEAAPADTEVTEDEVPLAATDDFSQNEGDNLSDLPNSGEEVELNIDLGALQESIEQLAKTLEEDEEVEIDLSEADKDGDGSPEKPKWAKEKGITPKWADPDDSDPDKKAELDEEMDVDVEDDTEDPSADEEDADENAMKGLANLEEDIDADTLVDAIMEKLTVDMGFDLSGWAGRPTSQLKDEQEMELAAEASDDTLEEDDDSEEDLNESLTELEDENNSLKAQLDKYKQVVEEIKENLYEVNLSNARLLYTNRVLRNTSLNERQKDKIVDAISSAGSVAEAKTIFETLQSAVEAKPKHSPQSLSEAIGHKASVIRATRKEAAQPQDAFSDRMRRLAGIKS
ncbi:MAG: hypothetical protein VW907_00245 [Opitutae bacterium]